MRHILLTRTAVLAVATAAAGCAPTAAMNSETTPAPAAPAPAAQANPLLAEWTGPHGGVPPFDRVRVADFVPAFEAAMAENLAEVERIAGDPAAPTFENTVLAFERAGSTLRRVSTIYGVWSSSMSSPEFQAVQREMAPRLAAFNDRISQNEALFRRFEAVDASPGEGAAHARAAAPALGAPQQLRARRRPPGRRQEGAPVRDQPAARRPLHLVQPDVLADESDQFL
jgi:peptidyl-dipeptidase Dcp